MLKVIAKIGLEGLKFKRELPEDVYKGYLEANGAYPQVGMGIVIEVLNRIVNSKNFDFLNARKYGFSRKQYLGIRKKMESLHKSVGIKVPLMVRFFIRFKLKVVTLYLLNNGILGGIEDYFKKDPNPSLEELKKLSEKLKSILERDEIQREAKDRWQKLRNGDRTTVSQLEEMLTNLLNTELTQREHFIYTEYIEGNFLTN